MELTFAKRIRTCLWVDISLILRWRHWGSERFSSSPDVVGLITGSAGQGFELQSGASKLLIWPTSGGWIVATFLRFAQCVTQATRVCAQSPACGHWHLEPATRLPGGVATIVGCSQGWVPRGSAFICRSTLKAYCKNTHTHKTKTKTTPG